LAGPARTVAEQPMLAARGCGNVDSCASAHEDDDARSRCSTSNCTFSTSATSFSSIADALTVPPPADGAVALSPPPHERLALPAAGTGSDGGTQSGGSRPPSPLLRLFTCRVGVTPLPEGSSPSSRGGGGGGSGSRRGRFGPLLQLLECGIVGITAVPVHYHIATCKSQLVAIKPMLESLELRVGLYNRRWAHKLWFHGD